MLAVCCGSKVRVIYMIDMSRRLNDIGEGKGVENHHFNFISMINKSINLEKAKIGYEVRSALFPNPNDKVRIQQN